MLKKHFFFSVVFVAVLALFAVSCGASETVEVEDTGPEIGLEVGDIAPDIAFTGLDGKEYQLSDFRGQVVFLNFWATWCPPCVYEMPSMEDMYQDHKDEGFVIVAISIGGYGETQENVEQFMEDLGLTFPAFLDYDKSAFKELNKSPGIPETYIINQEGVITEWIPGARDWSTLENRRTLLRLLGGE